jgi:hypothetical protein
MPATAGVSAAVTEMPDSRSANDLSTSSNCLPPITDWLNAFDMPLANVAVLSVRLVRRTCVPARAALRPLTEPSSRSVIGIPCHQFKQRRPLQWRASSGQCFDGERKLAWRHPPETFGLKTQRAESDADRLFPRERFDSPAYTSPGAYAKGLGDVSAAVSSPPNVAAIRLAAIFT